VLSAPVQGKEVYLGNAGTAARVLTAVGTLVKPPTSSTCHRYGDHMQRTHETTLHRTARTGKIKYIETVGCLLLSIVLKEGLNESSLLCAPYASSSEGGGGGVT